MRNHKSDEVGDAKTPALQATESGLRTGAEQAREIAAEKPGGTRKSSAVEDMAGALKAASRNKGSPASCTQFLWLSFFFDGTGNNRDADTGMKKHSNITRLFFAHKTTSDDKEICSVYIPGIGTYFPEIGDDGGSKLGLGCGKMGDKRLDFALEKFDDFLKRPLAQAKAPANAIQEINIAVFGFSRGAALARAFVNMVMKERCLLRAEKWTLKNGNCPVRFRFLGLFDSVASVGLPLSFNTTGGYEALTGDTAGLMKNRLRKYQATRPEVLAFSARAAAGADPAPGGSHGHDEWGNRLNVHATVEEVRHFVAAHEIRNSFPLDSVSTSSKGRISTPRNFYETVYPGAHSDVGGGYAPGEGARGINPSESMSLIPLRQMYGFALRAGVPMLVEATSDNNADFKADPTMCAIYDRYLKAVGSFTSLGEGMNKHMALYYAWRFRSIKLKLKGDKREANLIQTHDGKFRQHEAALTKEVGGLESKEMLAKLTLNGLTEVQHMNANASDGSVTQKALTAGDASVERARENYDAVHEARMKAKARKDGLPNMNRFQKLLDMYDQRLLADVAAIRPALPRPGSRTKMEDLRPHYKALIEAYENEFEKNNGLKDEAVISFFDNYVHDSLAGFGGDATLPSDPRVVYLGGDEKYKYASVENQDLFLDAGTRVG
jgi:hypothetical protein